MDTIGNNNYFLDKEMIGNFVEEFSTCEMDAFNVPYNQTFVNLNAYVNGIRFYEWGEDNEVIWSYKFKSTLLIFSLY